MIIGVFRHCRSKMWCLNNNNIISQNYYSFTETRVMGTENNLWKFKLDPIIFMDITGIWSLKKQRNKLEWWKLFDEEYRLNTSFDLKVFSDLFMQQIFFSALPKLQIPADSTKKYVLSLTRECHNVLLAVYLSYFHFQKIVRKARNYWMKKNPLCIYSDASPISIQHIIHWGTIVQKLYITE